MEFEESIPDFIVIVVPTCHRILKGFFHVTRRTLAKEYQGNARDHAGKHVVVQQWDQALMPTINTSTSTMNQTAKMPTSAPITAMALA